MSNTNPAICGLAVCGCTTCGYNSVTPVSLEVITAPNKKVYNTNESFSNAGMSVKATYSDGTSAILNDSDYYCSSIDISEGSVIISHAKNGVTATGIQEIFVTRPGCSDQSLSVELTRSGTALLDLYTKNIKFVHSDINTDALHLPFSVSHIYNAKNAENNEANCGYGWQTNFHQRIVSPAECDDDDAEYVFIDGNGNRNKIIKLNRTEEDGTYKSVYVLYENQSTEYDPTARMLTDKNGNKSMFNSSGWLIEQLSADGYKISIVYMTSGKISAVREYENNSSAVNKEFVFSYPNSDRMTISFTSADNLRQNSIHFVYSANKLTKIYYETYGGSEYTAFTYDNKGILSSVQDPTGHKVSYSCSGKTVTVTETPGSITKHSDITDNLTVAISPRVWKVAYGGNTRVTKDGKTSVIGFGKNKRYAFSFEDQSDGSDVDKLDVTGDIEFSQTIDLEPGQESYNNVLTDTVKKCGTVSASLSKTLPDLGTGFTYDLSNNLNVHNPQDTTEKYVNGSSSIKVGAYIAHFSFNRLFETATVPAKKGYVVSAFVKPNPQSYNCELAAILYDSDDNIVDVSVWEFNYDNPEWQAGAVCLDNPKLRGVKIKVMITSSNRNDSRTPMYVGNLRVVEQTFDKSVAIEDDPATEGYYESLLQTFGTGASSETKYKIVNDKVKTHLLSRNDKDEFGNETTSSYVYDENNGKLKYSKEADVENTYTYGGYMGSMSAHTRSAFAFEQTDQTCYSLSETDSARIHTQKDVWSGSTVKTNLRTALVQASGDADGNQTLFSYDAQGDKTSMTLDPAVTDGNSYYYTKFLLTKVVSGNNIVHYIYDGFGQLLQVRLNGTILKTYSFRDTCDYTATSSESNYNYEEQTVPDGTGGTYSQKILYNADGQPIRKQEKTNSGSYSDLVTMSYATSDGGGYKKGELKTVTDVASGSSVTQTLTYDTAMRRIKKITYSGGRTGSIENTYSTGGVLTDRELSLNGDTIEYNYCYTDNSALGTTAAVGKCKYIKSRIGNFSWFATRDYNSLHNVSGRTVYRQEIDPYTMREEYRYATNGKSVSGVAHYNAGSSSAWALERYEYDQSKNISKYIDVLSYSHNYKYDAAGRLIREDNQAFGFTKIYTYDGGNISTVTSYAYTTAESPTGGNTVTYNYYSNTDKLLNISGINEYSSSIPYNFAENPLQWKENVLQWNRGKRLIRYGNISFTYDGGGTRQSKTANGVTHTYYTEDGMIHKEELSNGNKLVYAYDESGIAAVAYNGIPYYVQKNIQGDVVALSDWNGNVVAKYVYDAWGNQKVYDGNGIENTSSTFIGNVNPFRYRGYYFDAETGLYYLQMRYYDPAIGRFISPDSIDYIDPESFNGLNLFAYCGNNPVMNIDPEGTWSWGSFWKVMAGIGVVLAVTAATVLTAGAAAVALGASTAVASSVISGALVGGLIAGGVNLAVQGWTNGVENINYGDLALSTFIGASSSALGGAAGELSAGINAGTKLLIHKGLQVSMNVLISNTFYIGQSVVSGNDVTLYGLTAATVGGIVSGLTFNNNALSSTFISLGIELAGYVEELFLLFL